MRRWPVVLGALILTTLTACSSGSSAKTDPTNPPTTARATTPSTRATSTTRRPNAASTTPSTKPALPSLADVRIGLTRVVSGLDSPVDLAWRAHDTRMFVAEQGGNIRVVSKAGQLAAAPLLRIGPLSHGNEEGLLGITFSRDGSKLYVDYTDPDMDTHIDEYTMRGDVAVPSSRRQVLTVEQPFANHNGGQVTIGTDGMLYIGLGDGGSAGDPHHNGQNLGTLLAKILRIDPNAKGGAAYSIPAGNPFIGKSGARPETWMWGLRNPWRFSFDRKTGDMWIGDVGQDQYEEIDFAPKGDTGVNWGWNAREGFHAYRGGDTPPGARDPIVETSHADGTCAIVGGYVYRGKAIPALNGVYLFGDNCDSQIVGVVESGSKAVAQRDLGPTAPQLTTFGEDPSGEVYAVTRDGTVYRFTAA